VPPQAAQRVPPPQAKSAAPRDTCAEQRQALVELKSELKAMPEERSDSLFRTNQREDSALRVMRRNNRSEHEISATKNRYEHLKQDLEDSFRVRLESVNRKIAVADAATKSRACKLPKGR
jgi:exonuclease VII large subunit